MKAAARSEAGLATLETILMLAVLVPILFAVIEFGALYERWLSQDAVTLQAARLAGEVGGDRPEVRALVAGQLLLMGIDPARVSVAVEPPSVGWRQPVRVSLRSDYTLAIPFLFSTTLPLRSTAIARGEVNR